MKKSTELNSGDWCDLIFEKKNKEYGAYAMRQNSWKYHLIAFVTTVVIVVLLAFLPAIIGSLRGAESRDKLGGYDGDYIVSKIDLNQPDAIVIPPKLEKPIIEPIIKKAIGFTAPVITTDNEIGKEREMKAMDNILKTAGVISFKDQLGSLDKNAIHPDELRKYTATIVDKKSEPRAYVNVEVMPQFPGGERALMEFIASNLRYPIDAQNIGASGRVILRFVVSKTGAIEDLSLVRGFHPSCDREALQMLKKMPTWIPGKQNGVAVPVYFNLPVVFRLQN